MNRAIALLLIASFALFAGSPVLADMILSTGSGPECVPDAASKASDILVQVSGGPVADAEAQAYFDANPDQVHQTAVIGMIGVLALVVFLGSVYVFGATDHPHPGW
jgi:hypothetical protein